MNHDSCFILTNAALPLYRKALIAAAVVWAGAVPRATGLSTHVSVTTQRVRLPSGRGLGLQPGVVPRAGNENETEALFASIGPFDDLIPSHSNGILGGNKTQSDVIRVTLNGAGDTSALISAVIFSSIGAVSVLLLFSVLRRFNPAVYTRATSLDVVIGRAANRGDLVARSELAAGLHEVAEESSAAGFAAPLAALARYLDWFWLALGTAGDEEVKTAGLDAWVLLEFHRLNRRIFTMIGPPILAVLIPVHYMASWKSNQTDFISRLDIASLPDTGGIWYLHAVLVWFVVGATTWCIRSAHEEFLERRFKWLQELPAPQVTTIMVENIPEDYRSDKALKNYFNNIFGQGSVERAYMVRKTKELRDLVNEFNSLKVTLLLADRRWQQAGYPPSGKEMLDQYKAKLGRLSESILQERAAIEDACRGEEAEGSSVGAGTRALRDKYCSPSGFVTFSDQLKQRLASRERYRKDVTEIVVTLAPDPTDVIYDDLEQEVGRPEKLEIVGWACLIGLFLSWSPVVVFISSWTTLGTIQEYVPFLGEWVSKSPRLSSILEGVLATAALKLFLAWLPIILLGIIRSFFILKSGAWAQVRLERWYFSFLTIFVLLVTILGRSIVITLVVVLQKPTEIMDLLAGSLPSASHFYFNYLILGWFTHAWELIRFANLWKFWLYRVLYQLPLETAKEYCEPENEGSFGMGTRMAVAVLMSAITFVFCTCSPLIMLFAWVYFWTGRMTYGYLLLRAETKKPDLGGRFWIEALNQVFFALIVYVFLMTGVLAAHGELAAHSIWRRFGPAMVAASAFIALYWQWRKVSDLAWDSLPLQVLVEANFTPQGQRGEYVQRECVSSVDVDVPGRP